LSSVFSGWVASVAGDEEAVSGCELPPVCAGATQVHAKRLNKIAVFCRGSPAILLRCTGARARLLGFSDFTPLRTGS
jgi:hypothetical protein